MLLWDFFWQEYLEMKPRLARGIWKVNCSPMAYQAKASSQSYHSSTIKKCSLTRIKESKWAINFISKLIYWFIFLRIYFQKKLSGRYWIKRLEIIVSSASEMRLPWIFRKVQQAEASRRTEVILAARKAVPDWRCTALQAVVGDWSYIPRTSSFHSYVRGYE